MQMIPHQVSAVKSVAPNTKQEHSAVNGNRDRIFIIILNVFPTPSPSSQLGTQEPSEGRFGCGSCQEEVRWCSAPLLYCTFTSGCRDEPMYRPYCPSWKQEFGCSYVTRPNWPESINSLCQKTCGLCGIVNNIM